MNNKYDIELTSNNITKKGFMSLTDNSLIINLEGDIKEFYYNDMQDIKKDKKLLKIVLNDKNILYIKTINIEDIISFINLQKNDDNSYQVTFKQKKDYSNKYFRRGFLIGFLLVFIYNIIFIDEFIFFGCLVWGSIFGIVGGLIGYATIMHTDKARTKCPSCNKEVILTRKVGEVSLPFEENEIGSVTCPNCQANLGVKYNHIYRITPQNEHEFNLTKKEEFLDNEDNFQKLEKLKNLLDKNIITEDEFNKKKEELLKKI